MIFCDKGPKECLSQVWSITNSQRVNISGCVNNNRVIILQLMLHKAKLHILVRNVGRMFDLEKYVFVFIHT